MGISKIIKNDGISGFVNTLLNTDLSVCGKSTYKGNDHFSFYDFSTPIKYESWLFEAFRNNWIGVDDFLNNRCRSDLLQNIRILFRQKYPGHCYDIFIFARKSSSCKNYHIGFEKADNEWAYRMTEELNKGKAIPISLYRTKNGEQRIIKLKSHNGDGYDNPWHYFHITSDNTLEIRKYINRCGPMDISGIRLLCPQDYPHENDSLHLFCRKDNGCIKWDISRKRVSSGGWFVDNIKGLKRGDYTILDTYEDHPDLNYLFVVSRV